MTYFGSLRQDLFTDVEMSQPLEAMLQGMNVLTSTGAAKREGLPVESAVALFEPHAGTIVAALYVGEVDAWKMYSEALEAMIGSLEPVAP